jgi:hypothetical protein
VSGADPEHGDDALVRDLGDCASRWAAARAADDLKTRRDGSLAEDDREQKAEPRVGQARRVTRA